MPDIYNGVIPYGSGDSSVVLECDHKSAASIDAANGTLQAGATITEDGVVVGPAGGALFDLTAIVSAIKDQLQYTGQLSFKTDALHIGCPSAEWAESLGYIDSVYFIHADTAIGTSAPYMKINVQGSTDVISAALAQGTDVLDNSQAIHEVYGEADNGNITISMAWDGGVTSVHANGCHLYDTERNIYLEIFERIMSGGLLTGAFPVEGATISDLVLAARPVQYSTHEILANCAWYGDSLVDQSDLTVMYNAGCTKSFDAHMRRMGLKCDSIEAGVSGHFVIDSETLTVASQIDGTNATKPNLGVNDLHQLLSMFADFTNDVIVTGTDLDQSFADRQGHIQTILDSNSKAVVIVGNVPSVALDPTYDNATVKARVDYINGLIDTLPAVMTALDSSYTDRVRIADRFTAFGGHDPVVKLYQLNNIHPSGFGQYLEGDIYASEAVEFLG